MASNYWASEASPTLGCSIEISCDIYIYVGMSALAWTKKNRSLRNGKLKAKSASETEDRVKKG